MATTDIAASGTDSLCPVSDDTLTGISAAAPPKAALPVVLKHLGPKEVEWSTIVSKRGPLTLLDLPVDVLGLILQEVSTHNGLTALALTNSVLYSLAIPFIYSNFDIVWPDESTSSSTSTGVDALTYGLSTLSLGSRFGQTSRWLRGAVSPRPGPGTTHRLAHNQYATYVRKFSLGNGKDTEVAEFSLGLDSGKMLSTLVSLAVAKMINLESFIWNMPTGVPSDVFMALASLQDHFPAGQHKLAKIWVRWQGDVTVRAAPPSTVSSSSAIPVHNEILDFFMGAMPQPSGTPRSVNLPLPPHLQPKESLTKRYAECEVEYPTFSILPAVESLTVLDLAEMAYLDEISQLVQRSRSALRELRIGLASSACSGEINWLCDGDKFKQVDLAATWPGESSIGDRRLGGVLGVVFGRVFDLKTTQFLYLSDTGDEHAKFEADRPLLRPPRPTTIPESIYPPQDQREQTNKGDPAFDRTAGCLAMPTPASSKLGLEVLELEKLALSTQICRHVFDWSRLTTLTILDCTQHESLWRMLRKDFQPEQGFVLSPVTRQRYPLTLKHIRVDQVSMSLINFLKDTLAPNSLETLYLQARRASGLPAVKLSQIMKGPIRHHQTSLRSLRLDSVYFKDGLMPVASGYGRSHWALSSSWVTYLTSGRLKNLRELAVAFDGRAWHPFLRGFPDMTELRILHVLGLPNRTDHSTRRETAIQVADVLTLRPNSKLYLFGIGDICYEIMEAHTSKRAPPDVDLSGLVVANGVIVIDPGTDTDSSTTSGSDSDAPAVPPPPPPPFAELGSVVQENPGDWSPDESVVESDTESWRGSDHVQETPSRWLYLHQIPFCDDKVNVFRARHARLGGGR